MAARINIVRDNTVVSTLDTLLDQSSSQLPEPVSDMRGRPASTREYSTELPSFDDAPYQKSIPMDKIEKNKSRRSKNGSIEPLQNVGKTSVTTELPDSFKTVSHTKFNVERFLDRLAKFYSSRGEDIDKFLDKSSKASKNNLSLNKYLQDHYINNFSSPMVDIGVDNLEAILLDYIRFKGDLSQSTALDNVLELKGVPYDRHLLKDDVEELSTQDTNKDSKKGSLNNIKSTDTLLVSDVEDFLIENAREFSVIPFVQPLKIDMITSRDLIEGLQKKKKNEDGGITTLTSPVFNSCRNFQCDKFKIFSVSDLKSVVLKSSKVESETVLFRVCCDSYNCDNCPQSDKYNEIEQTIYDSAISSHGDLQLAHNQILNFRLKHKK